MNLKKAFVNSCLQTFHMFGFSLEFVKETQESTLNSAEEITILIGLTNGLEGNIAIGLPLEVALQLVSTMLGGVEVAELDEVGKSALGEISNMLVGSTMSSLSVGSIIEFSPPTIAIGDEVFIMISNSPASKLFFRNNEKEFHISYAVS